MIVTIIVALLASAGGVLGAHAARQGTTITGDPVAGKKDYRTFCGQCHALAAALAAGFGGVGKYGENGGPSFDDMKISATLAYNAVTELFSGHELILKKMTWTQIDDVCAFVELATKHHPIVGKITDGG